MDISVVICTYNRAASLRRTLEQFKRVEAESIQWELLVIDNNSTDDTRKVCEAFRSQLPLRYVFESCQGKSHALNRATAESAGELLLFTDDDVDVDHLWIRNYLAAAQRHPDAVFFGGKIIPRWEKQPPRWMEQHCTTQLRTVAVSFDMGQEEVRLTNPEFPFVGANQAFLKKIFGTKGIAYRSDLGPTGNQPVRGEETFLVQQLMQQGFIGWYIPDAVVHHRNPPERMTERYVREWHIGEGMRQVRLGEQPASQHTWFGAPRYLWRQLAGSFFLYCLSRYTQRSEVWLRHECRMACKLGAIYEFRKQRKNAKPNPL